MSTKVHISQIDGWGDLGDYFTFEAFPVWSIYMNVDGANPATTLGYGVWQFVGLDNHYSYINV